MLDKLIEKIAKTSKKQIVIAISAVTVLFLIFILATSGSNKKQRQIIAPTVTEENISVNQNNAEDNASGIDQSNLQEAVKAAQEETSTEQSSAVYINETNTAQSEQAEAIERIKKRQKPDNMIVYLKSIQADITLNARDKSFKYELKEYREGDALNGWFEIEAITPTLIRFKDTDYSYNLRFFEEKEQQ